MASVLERDRVSGVVRQIEVDKTMGPGENGGGQSQVEEMTVPLGRWCGRSW